MFSPRPTTSRNFARLRFIKEVYWRQGGLVVLGIYNGLQLISNIIAWTTSPETQQKYQLIKIVQWLSLRTWIGGLLILLLLIGLEGAFKLVRSQEISSGKRVAQHETTIELLRKELEPKISIIYEPRFPFLYRNAPSGIDEIRIGVKNIGGRELTKVRVLIDEVQIGNEVYNSQLLHLTRTKRSFQYPYQTEFSLNPDDIEYLDLAFSMPDHSWATFSYSGGAPDHIKKGQTYKFSITATSSEGKSVRSHALLVANGSPPFSLTLCNNLNKDLRCDDSQD